MPSMTNHEAASCRVCGSTMRTWTSRWLGFEWGRCVACKSVQKIIDHSCYLSLGAAYDPGYIETELLTRSELEKRMGVEGKTKLLRRVLGPGSRGGLLDIGCGMGGFLLAAQRLGFDVVGVEPSAAHSKAAVEIFGFKVINGYFNSNDFGRTFDVVVLSHVIEHIYDPAKFIGEIMDVMRPNGRLVIVTPNCDSISARVCQRFWSMYKPVDHVTLFTKRALAGVVPADGRLQFLKTSEWPGEFAAHVLSSLKTFLQPVATGAGEAARPQGPIRKSNLSFATRFVLAALSFPVYLIGWLFDKQSCLYAVIVKRDFSARQ